jgi:hypothetical protein
MIMEISRFTLTLPIVPISSIQYLIYIPKNGVHHASQERLGRRRERHRYACITSSMIGVKEKEGSVGRVDGRCVSMIRRVGGSRVRIKAARLNRPESRMRLAEETMRGGSADT